jgi:tetratricopeptide (TPR) repeat protein
VKRAIGLVLLSALTAAAAYGVVVNQRESAYRRSVEQGDAALARDDSYAAIEAFSVAISLQADSMAAHLKRGEAYRRRGEYDAALRDLRRAAGIDPLAIHPRELLGDVHYAVAAADGTKVEAFTQAVERYRESVALDDRSARLQYKLGLALYRAGRVPEAMPPLREAIALEPEFAEAHYVLGRCLRAARQTDDAVRAMERAVVIAPALLAAREELADLYAALRRHDSRVSHLEALATLQPSPTRERALAIGYARAGNLDRAIGQLGRAARRYPDAPEIYVTLGELWLERAGEDGPIAVSKAIEALDSGVGGESTSEAMTVMGRALLLAGDAARAEALLRQATLRFPVAPASFLHLSEAARRRGRTAAAQRALIDYAALVPLDSLDVATLARLGDAYLAAGDRERARRAIAAALDRDAAYAPALAVRARLG